MEKEAIKHGVYGESSKLLWKCSSCSFLISATYELIIIIKLVFEKKLHLIMGRSSFRRFRNSLSSELCPFCPLLYFT